MSSVAKAIVQTVLLLPFLVQEYAYLIYPAPVYMEQTSPELGKTPIIPVWLVDLTVGVQFKWGQWGRGERSTSSQGLLVSSPYTSAFNS